MGVEQELDLVPLYSADLKTVEYKLIELRSRFPPKSPQSHGISTILRGLG